jgi:hypothetical protein
MENSTRGGFMALALTRARRLCESKRSLTIKLAQAIKINSVEGIEKALREGADPNAGIESCGGELPLHLATMAPDARALEALLAGGARVDEMSSSGGRALLYALGHKEAEAMVRLLLRHGAHPRGLIQSGPKGLKESQRPAIFSAQVNAWPPLKHVIENSTLGVAKALLDAGALSGEPQEAVEALIKHAAHMNRLDIAKLLWEAAEQKPKGLVQTAPTPAWSWLLARQEAEELRQELGQELGQEARSKESRRGPKAL